MRLILRNLARTIKVYTLSIWVFFIFIYCSYSIVTDNGWGTRRVCGYFHYKKSYHRRSCYKIKVGRVVARTKTICAKDKFYYCGWRKRRVCIISQEGYRVKYKKVYRCSSYTKTRLVKGGYQCKNYYFKYREFNAIIQAAN